MLIHFVNTSNKHPMFSWRQNNSERNKIKNSPDVYNPAILRPFLTFTGHLKTTTTFLIFLSLIIFPNILPFIYLQV